MHGSQKRNPNLPTLDAWLAQQPENEFPPHLGQPYPNRYKAVSDYLNHNVHPHVEKGAIVQREGYLTDHGPEHIKTVIRRAGELLAHPADSFPQLEPYEVYLFLMAAHFHDVGNIYGRKEHEKHAGPIMEELQKLAGRDMVEKAAIRRIAASHGGNIDGDKDTIQRLPARDAIGGKEVRFRAIAAILRFADELADDASRASRSMMNLGIIPPRSEVYHAYSLSLHSVMVKPAHNLIDLRFMFLKDDAKRKFWKGKKKVYLLDEIFDRTLKMHLERQYCMRFMRDHVQIDAIDVRIEVYSDHNSMTPCIDTIGYRLQERGYPTAKDASIRDLCPEIKFDGRNLQKKLG